MDAPPTILDVRTPESGPLRAALEVRLLYRIPSALGQDRRRRLGELVDLPVRVRVSLYAQNPQLDVDLELDNQAKDHRLRVHFPLPFPVALSDADGAYHVTRRAALAAPQNGSSRRTRCGPSSTRRTGAAGWP